tara:strand:- start:15960 stop:21974 length:6015 start_codon:yes stop_codon:yes gene_type:complete
MSIIKINHLEGNIIKKIYVFHGEHSVNKDWEVDGTNIFTKQESKNISDNNIQVELINAYIHGDDTISTIKKKIVQHTKIRVSTKELYLFGIHSKVLDPSVLYNQLTQVETMDLTKDRLCQYLLNIVPGECEKVNENSSCDLFLEDDKEEYDFEDFLGMKNLNWDTIQNITIPIGQNISLKKKYPYTVNPYNCVMMDTIIKTRVKTILTTQNSNLLFEYGNLCGNNIFVCIAEEVLEYSKDVPHLTEINFINLYFPNLSTKNNIDSLSKLKSKQVSLYDETRKTLNSVFDKYNEKIDLLYNVYYKRKTELPYQSNSPGIIQMEFTMHPKYNIKMPLEILFKLIRSDKQIPMVKYNPGRDRENIYRLFTNDEIATNGKSIPYLYTENKNKRGKIIRLSKTLAKKKRVAFYIEYSLDGNVYIITCDFETNGNINIKIEHNASLKLDVIEDIIKKAINEPILDKIKSYLEQSGYTFMLFDTFADDNIEFKNITFLSLLEIKKNIHLKNYMACLSGIFTIVEGDLTSQKNEIKMQYKRVSNYNEMDSIDSFINEMSKQEEPIDKIIHQLTENFNLTLDIAKEKFANWASQISTETNLFENKKITIRTNTGFPVSITRNKTNFETKIIINSINNVKYLQYIAIYIDTMLRMIIDKNSTEIPSKTITKLCKGKIIEDVVVEEDIKAKEIKFVSEEATSTFLDMFGEQDEDLGDMGDDMDFEMGDFEMDFETPKDSPANTPQIIQDTLDSPTESLDSPTESLDISPKSDITSEADVDLEGMVLKGNNNIFMKRKEELQPELFLKQSSGRYKAYSKACPSQYAKQPVILTQKEKTYIDNQDAEHGTTSYDEFISYGSGDKKFHYICPRFWCLYDDNGKSRSISLEDINKGKCGGWDAVIPQGAKSVPNGKRIVEFTSDRFHKSNVKTNNKLVYKPMFPGFMDQDKHPDGLCIPCCFGKPTAVGKGDWEETVDKKGKKIYSNKKTGKTQKKAPIIKYDDMYQPKGDGPGGKGPSYKTDAKGNIIMSSIKGDKTIRDSAAPSRRKTYNKCNQRVDGTKTDLITKKETISKMDEAPLLEAWPLKQGQLGYLPISVQRFLGYNCKDLCQQSASEARLKLDAPCLLHKGMEKSNDQSFLACIADMYYDMKYDDLSEKPHLKISKRPVMTIAQIKKIIVDKINIDNFIIFQNGNLVKIFGDDKDVNINKYKNSILYKSLQKSMKSVEFDPYFKRVVTALINFKAYIEDDASIINYEYLWDFICMSGDGLFKKGLNLIILNSPNDDITTKIELICPSNHYSSQNYDINKRILILYSRDGFFEPLYRYTRFAKNLYDVRKLFYLPDIGSTMPIIEPIMRTIWSNLVNKCKPLSSLPETYNKLKEFRSNITINEILKILDKSSIIYDPAIQIVNFNSKVIGVIAVKKSDKKDNVYIPCLPSAIDPRIPYEFIGRSDMWNTYTDTVNKLKYINSASKKKIPCAPKFKVVNNSVIIGVITETNQFVPSVPSPYQVSPTGNEPDGIEVLVSDNLKSDNYLDIDKTLFTNTSVDESRIVKVKQIKLESYFYNVFRNSLRVILSYYENKKEKDILLNIINSQTVRYLDKIGQVSEIIQKIMDKFVGFVIYDASTLNKINKIELCMNLSKDKCKTKPCTYSGEENVDGVCKILLSKNNLISGGDNEIQYFTRVANELIKFERIKTFIFKPQTFLSFQSMSYNLKDDEIILLEDLLYGNYFEDLIPLKQNKFIQNTSTWDNTSPSTSIPYVNNFNIGVELKTDTINKCIISDPKQNRLTLGKWRDKGLEKYQIKEFRQSNNCSWELIKEIININKIGINLKIGEVVDVLIDLYSSVLNSDKRTDILTIMRSQGKKYQSDGISSGTDIRDIITSTNYYLTSLDFFLLSQHYKIPLILLGRGKIPTTFSQYISFINNNSDECYVIYCGGFSEVTSDKGPIYGILSDENMIKLSTSKMGNGYTNITKLNIKSLDAYIKRAKQAAILGKRKKRTVVVKKPHVVKKKGKIKIEM